MSKMCDLQSGQARLQVVEEIRRAVAEGRFDARVEVGEEPLGLPQREELLSPMRRSVPPGDIGPESP